MKSKNWGNKEARKNKEKERTIRLQTILDDVKKKSSCADCGERDWRVLQFDHQTDKLKQVGHFTNEKDIMAEIAKCHIVCAYCHQIRTVTSRPRKTEPCVTVKKREDYIIAYKLALLNCKSCTRPITMQNHFAFDMHHVNKAEKIMNIAAMKTKSKRFPLEMLQKELEKCEMLCKNCHEVHTREERKVTSI